MPVISVFTLLKHQKPFLCFKEVQKKSHWYEKGFKMIIYCSIGPDDGRFCGGILVLNSPRC